MLRFQVDVTAADAASRTIEGVAVPFGEVAELSGAKYRFTPGSLRAARSRTPLLLGHDTNQPVGVLVEMSDTDQGTIARFRVDEGAPGDLALAQASSGSRGGLSIGAAIEAAEPDEAGVNVVTRASLFETSLVSIPAFAGAAVTTVTAEQDPDPAPEPDTTNQPDDPAHTPEEETVENTTPEPVAAERQAEIIVTAERQATPDLTPAQYVHHMVRAQKGDAESGRLVQAALSNLTTATEPGLVPEAYVNTLLGQLPDNRPLYEVVRHAPLPSVGMKLQKPIITQGAKGSWVAENAATPSNAFAVGLHEVQIEQWAGGWSLSVALIERGEGAAETVYRSAILDYHQAVEGAIMTELNLAAISTATSAGAGKVMDDIGTGAAKVFTESGRRPNAVAMAPDTWAKLLPVLGPLAFTGGSTSASTLGGTLSGLRIVVTPEITNAAIYVMDASVIEVRDSNPVQLRANVVGTMNVELGVTAFVAVDVEAPKAICRVGAAPTK